MTRIRNASRKQKEKVDIPSSRIKGSVLKVMREEGFIAGFKPIQDQKRQGVFRVLLKYTPQKEPVIRGLLRVSKPGRRVYCRSREIPRVRQGFGITILSTSKGVMAGSQAQDRHLGGEILCQLW